jgi:demethylmenaquinone methyltransferase / 2-methoxy-6-polyprenyl-1,4-benzoquinol methylase
MAERPDNDYVDFGYQTIAKSEKANKVAGIFSSVAGKYDLMNDLMSFSLHRLWKQYTINEANIHPGQCVLDVASGTGDLVKVFASQVGTTGKVLMTDINQAMLNHGRDRLINQGLLNSIEYIIADAECLPFTKNLFDCITIAFGLRNVTDKNAALSSMYRVLKPGGKLLILEFSTPSLKFLQKCYDLYSFHIIPMLGNWVTGDRASYQYLVESIRTHPNQETLKVMMQKANFEDVTYTNLSGGIVALHCGYKY